MPAFSLWKMYPGFDRLESTIKLSNGKSYVAEGVVRSLNRSRPAGEPKMTKCPLTAKVIAKEWRGMYRDMVRRGGA